MAVAHYKFRGVPKTFTTRGQALSFLRSSPGYVKRQSKYLQKFWPGLYQEIGSNAGNPKPGKDAKAWAAPRSIFVPPAFTGAPPESQSKAPKPGRAGPENPTYRQAVDRERFQLGLKTSGSLAPNVSDSVPAYRPPSPGLIDSIPGIVGDVITSGAGALEKSLRTYGAGDLLRDAVKAGDAVARAFTPTDYRADLSGGDFLGLGSMPAAQWIASGRSADALLGKSIPNLVEHPLRPVGPKELLSITGAAATILPIGRLGKTAAAIAKATTAAKRERLVVSAAQKIAKSHTPEEIAAQRKIIAAKLAKTEDRIPGRPLVPPEGDFLYHGSPDGILKEIDPSYHTQTWREGIGFYITESFDKAKGYAKGRTARGDRKTGAADTGAINAVRFRPGAKILDMDEPANLEFWRKAAADRGYSTEEFNKYILGQAGNNPTNFRIREEFLHQLYEEVGTDAPYQIEGAIADAGYSATTHIESKGATAHRVWIVKDASALELYPADSRKLADGVPEFSRGEHLLAQDEILARAEDLLPPVPQGPKTLNETVLGAMETALPVRAAQEAGYSVERGKRIDKAMRALESIGGVEGKAAAAKELSGELPKLGWGGFPELNQESYGAMIDYVVDLGEDVLRPWEKIRIIWGLERAMKNGVPTLSEIALIEKAFGKTVAENLGSPENMGIMRLLHHYGLDLWNTPRSIMASFDLSAPFRQGMVAGARHPQIFAKNFLPMVKAFGKDEAYLAIMDDIASRPNFPLYEKAKLAITDATGAVREEQFPGSLVDRVPGVIHSSRAYSAFLNKMRVDVFDQMVDVARSQGKSVDDPRFLDALGEYINTSTGRGRIPGKHGESAANFLNTFLFSPRLLASRFQIMNPVYYASLYRRDPFVAFQAMKALGSTLAGISTMLFLASQITGVRVGMNPYSADFGRIRIGDTRIDIAGGFQPLIVLYARLVKGKSVSSSSGQTQDLKGGFGNSTRLDLGIRFLEGKMAPTPGLLRDLANGQKTFIGQPMTPGGVAFGFSPLNLQGSYDTYKTEDSLPAAAGAALLGSIGFGVGSYPDKRTGSSSPTPPPDPWESPSSPGSPSVWRP